MPDFELNSTEAPALVWWIAADRQRPGGWLRLAHLCGGLARNELTGWVLPIKVPDSTVPFLYGLDAEEFAQGCKGGNLDYEVSAAHQAAYGAYLEARGLKTAQIAMLQQAVYPLDPNVETLRKLSIESIKPPTVDALLVLGWNNH